jgi:NAD(P)-dependent dehydrogenase (short-subunit alcohol dehydrogenase family)
MKLEGQTALVTGASRGIGYEIALGLAREGADVAVTARSAKDLEALKQQIEGLGRRCAVIVADLGRRGAVDTVWAETQRAFPQLDILVNNAGLGSSSNPKPIVDFDDDFWEQSLYLNMTVPYLLCKRALPSMLARKYGRIINIASINGKTPSFHGAAYAASKHGLIGLTRTLALEVAMDGITVNAICPGPVRTLMNNKRVAYDAQRMGMPVEQLEATMTPLGRRLEPHELAPLAVYLASREASVMTGQAINIDGGRLMAA